MVQHCGFGRVCTLFAPTMQMSDVFKLWRLGWFQTQKAMTDDSLLDVQGKSLRLRQTSHPTSRTAQWRPPKQLKNQSWVEGWNGICKFRFGPPGGHHFSCCSLVLSNHINTDITVQKAQIFMSIHRAYPLLLVKAPPFSSVMQRAWRKQQWSCGLGA